MILNLMDRSYYFKGLLVLSKIDKFVSYQEKEILKIVGVSLGFNREFCDTTINEVIKNKHIKNEPLKFSNQQVANMFLRDAIKLAFSDSSLDVKEYEWLIECAKVNGILKSRINEQIASIFNSEGKPSDEQLDVLNYDWQSLTLPQVNINTKEKVLSS